MGRELPLGSLAGHSTGGQLTEDKTGDTHQIRKAKPHLPSRGDDRSRAGGAGVSTAGVRWDIADQRGLCAGGHRAGANEAHMAAQTGSGLSLKSPSLLTSGQALTQALFTNTDVRSKIQNLRMHQRPKPTSHQGSSPLPSKRGAWRKLLYTGQMTEPRGSESGGHLRGRRLWS